MKIKIEIADAEPGQVFQFMVGELEQVEWIMEPDPGEEGEPVTPPVRIQAVAGKEAG